MATADGKFIGFETGYNFNTEISENGVDAKHGVLGAKLATILEHTDFMVNITTT